MKQLFAFLSMTITAAAFYYIDPLFVLLLPIHLFEIASHYINKLIIIFVIMLLPMPLIPVEMLTLYVLVATLSFALYTIIRTYTSRMLIYRKDIENMHYDIQRLTRNLNENNEYIRQSEYTYKLEERNRLSQEIHDKIGHSMTGALIQMEASKRLMATDREKSAELLQNAIDISKDGIESIRLVLKNIKPPTEQLGINRLKLFVDEFSAKHSLKTLFTFGGNVDIISPMQWKIIMENTKEALTNTLKYSNATMISLDIRVLNTIIRVEVADNGRGASKIVKGLGIQGMEERTAAVNGTIIVDGSKGFSVTTLLPYQLS
ncbi:signal transduction histidine kinase [Bacillus horti]|uniref:histidine kinase n=2 Tax=Caldalkalibacillus horti TaxID=77523 RepID=A0ABT9W5U1_9BACI|nr:signal transduction histidine kinase [Bacillus horti]